MRKKRKLFGRYKRVFDLTLCIILLPILLPLLFIISIAIRVDSPGPPIFVQKRIGKGGKPFDMYKFRTMHHNYFNPEHQKYMQAYIVGDVSEDVNDRNGSFKPMAGEAVTKVGRILRKTSLDELPQIFNILKGEMSIIGPRPNVVWEVDKYKYWHYERLDILPGITGLAQAKGRSKIKFDNIARYDIQYARDPNFLSEIEILLKTMLAVIKRNGAQ